MDTEFYIYLYLREHSEYKNKFNHDQYWLDSLWTARGTPYYVGKGCGNRAVLYHGNTTSTIPTPPDKYIVYPATNLYEIEALYLETVAINLFKPFDLRNKQQGSPSLFDRQIDLRVDVVEAGEGALNAIYSAYTLDIKERVQRVNKLINEVLNVEI